MTSYDYFSAEWYITILFLFVCLYGLMVFRNNFRRLAAIILLFSASLPVLLIAGKITEDISTTQAMASAIIITQTCIAFIGLNIIKRAKIKNTAGSIYNDRTGKHRNN